MNSVEVGEMLGAIIRVYMGLTTDRVVLADETFDAPKDKGIYVTLAPGDSKLLAVKSEYLPSINKERMCTVYHLPYNIEIMSRDDTAKERNQEVVMALNSISAQMTMEANNCRIFRTGAILNLTAIEGVAALKRYRVPVIVSNVETKDSTPSVIDKFTPVTIKAEA
jgi:hypothetical protein